MKLIFVTFDLSRAMCDELQQIIVCAASSVDRFLQPGVFGQ